MIPPQSRASAGERPGGAAEPSASASASTEARAPRASFTRSFVAFLALPGVVAFAVPAIWLAATQGFRGPRPLGLPLVASGIAGLLWCVRDFHVRGRGSLAPWAPPRELVVVGLYRWSRNPMYLSVLVLLLGWAATFTSRGLAIYAAGVAVAFHLRVVLGEEPWLARTHGESWQRYAARVPRWLGRSGGTLRRSRSPD